MAKPVAAYDLDGDVVVVLDSGAVYLGRRVGLDKEGPGGEWIELPPVPGTDRSSSGEGPKQRKIRREIPTARASTD